MIEVNANTAEFKVALGKFVEKAKGKTLAFFSEFSQDLSAAVKEATPVDTGFLKNSWQVTINGEPVPEVIGLKLGDVFGYVNTAVYGRRLEFGFVGTDSLGRKYNQQPRSFVRDTVAKSDVIAEETLHRIGA